jgi:hypothetical protein
MPFCATVIQRRSADSTSATTRARLIDGLTRDLVPLLLQAGFEGPASIRGNTLLHEYRRRAGNGTHVLTIQLEKRQRPRFLVLLHVEPPEGIEALTDAGGEITTGSLKPRPGPTSRSWFRADPPWWQRVFRATPPARAREAVEECVRLLPEVDAWWTRQTSSPHISSMVVKYAGNARASGRVRR